MTRDDQRSWKKQDVSLRRAHFLIPDLMKLRAEKTLSEAAEVIKNFRDTDR